MAISTLAGSLLIETAPQAPTLIRSCPLPQGLHCLLLGDGKLVDSDAFVILALWRYVFMRIPLRCDPLNWGAVFHLGMYAAATWRMAHAMDLGFLQPVRRQINCEEGWRRDLRVGVTGSSGF